MPRPRNPKNEVNRSAQERYRAKLVATGGAATDAVDAVISAAVALWWTEAVRADTKKNQDRIRGLEQMACSLLVSKGKDHERAMHAILLRTRRSDIESLQEAVKRFMPQVFVPHESSALPPLLLKTESEKNIA
ncbi:UNVERIFIED_ORG: alpha-D-ribose 1-methylphosphonate 5-triphosphate diphosphatase PhnM [Rhizobium esperanzae]